MNPLVACNMAWCFLALAHIWLCIVRKESDEAACLHLRFLAQSGCKMSTKMEKKKIQVYNAIPWWCGLYLVLHHCWSRISFFPPSFPSGFAAGGGRSCNAQHYLYFSLNISKLLGLWLNAVCRLPPTRLPSVDVLKLSPTQLVWNAGFLSQHAINCMLFMTCSYILRKMLLLTLLKEWLGHKSIDVTYSLLYFWR